MTNTRRSFFGQFAAVFFPLVIPASALGSILGRRMPHELVVLTKPQVVAVYTRFGLEALVGKGYDAETLSELQDRMYVLVPPNKSKWVDKIDPSAITSKVRLSELGNVVTICTSTP